MIYVCPLAVNVRRVSDCPVTHVPAVGLGLGAGMLPLPPPLHAASAMAATATDNEATIVDWRATDMRYSLIATASSIYVIGLRHKYVTGPANVWRPNGVRGTASDVPLAHEVDLDRRIEA
jgi:hypothetical protein